MTGLDPTRHGVHSNLGHLLHPDLETLAEVLAGHGFATAGFVSSLVLDQRFGLDQGFAVYQDDLSARTRTIFGAERPGTETVALAARWLQLHRDERFFLFVHLYEPHEPYLPPPEFARVVPESPYLGEVATADAARGPAAGRPRRARLADVNPGRGGRRPRRDARRARRGHPHLLRLPERAPGAVHRQACRGGRRSERVEQLTGLVDVTPTLCGLLGVPPMPGTRRHRPEPDRCASRTPGRTAATRSVREPDPDPVRRQPPARPGRRALEVHPDHPPRALRPDAGPGRAQ